MKELLKEKILLEEPEDELEQEKAQEEETLPDAVPEEPIEISTEPIPEPEEYKLPVDSLVNILSSELSSIYNNIADLKTLIITFSDRQEVVDILNEIIDERTMHIGMLQKAIDILDNSHEDLVDAGEEKAETIASEQEANELDNK